MTDAPLLDPGPLTTLASFGADIPREMIELFAEEMVHRLDGLDSALAAGDLEGARIHAHSAKGGGGNLGLKRFAEVASEAEHAARDGDAAALPGLATRLRDLYGPSLQALREAFLA
jgi:HPt (histidine-containing phosphotransfer) domain-containing protein